MKIIKDGFSFCRITSPSMRTMLSLVQKVLLLKVLFILTGGGNITGWDEEREAHAKKLVSREMKRLQESFRLAWEAGIQKVCYVPSLSAYKYT